MSSDSGESGGPDRPDDADAERERVRREYERLVRKLDNMTDPDHPIPAPASDDK